MMHYFVLWWRGFLTVRVEGVGLEQFLNELTKAEIPLWQVQSLTLDVLLIRIPVVAYSKLRVLLWGHQIQIQIMDRHGFPFLARKLKQRVFLGLGLGLTFLCLIYLSSFIWFIELTGNEQITTAQFGEVLRNSGLKIGTARKNLDQRGLETTLLLRFPDLVWAEVSLEGVKAVIEVAERDMRPGEEARVGDIYAKQAGLVQEVLVLRGTALVAEGDTVREGDLLISGQYYDQRGQRQLGAARGLVLARVWYQEVGEASFTKWEAVHTGVIKRQFVLALGSLRVPFGKSYNSPNYLVTKKTWCLHLGRALLPLEWTRVEYAEVNYLPRTLSNEQVRQMAFERAWENLLARGVDPKKVLEQWSEATEISDAGGMHLTLWVEVEEEIGQFFPQ